MGWGDGYTCNKVVDKEYTHAWSVAIPVPKYSRKYPSIFVHGIENKIRKIFFY
jgi:hypothetical protein